MFPKSEQPHKQSAGEEVKMSVVIQPFPEPQLLVSELQHTNSLRVPLDARLFVEEWAVGIGTKYFSVCLHSISSLNRFNLQFPPKAFTFGILVLTIGVSCISTHTK